MSGIVSPRSSGCVRRTLFTGYRRTGSAGLLVSPPVRGWASRHAVRLALGASHKMRLNQSSDSPADSSASAAAANANSADTSVSFFSTVSLELSVL